MTNRRIHFFIFVVFLMGVTLCLFGFAMVRPVFSSHALESIEGATREDVRLRLGPPTEIMEHGEWIYTWWPNQGWVAISFDENGRVRSIDDESVVRAEKFFLFKP